MTNSKKAPAVDHEDGAYAKEGVLRKLDLVYLKCRFLFMKARKISYQKRE